MDRYPLVSQAVDVRIWSLLEGEAKRWSLLPGPTRGRAWLMNRQKGRGWEGGKHEADRRETELEISFSRPLYLSFSLPLCLCLLPTSAVSQSLTSQPTSPGGRAAPFHSHMNSSSTTTGKGLCVHLQVLSPTSLGVDLVIIINNCSSSRDKPSAYQTSRFCLWDGVARTDKTGVYLKAFYFGRRSAHHWWADSGATVCD